MLMQAMSFGALALSLLTQGGVAAPGSTPRSLLQKRYNTLTGCNAAQTTKVNKALADMANLGAIAYNNADTSSFGYKHYFKDDEVDVFKGAMNAISTNNDPSNAVYTFVVNCNPTGTIREACGTGKAASYAITDASVPADENDHKTIWLCPLFFTGPDTRNDLPNTDNKDELDAWCGQSSYKSFTTAGSVLLHEVTHLDAVSKLFPLDADDEGLHGTEDYAKGNSPIEWARRLKIQIDNQPNRKDVIQPIKNAESYAGAATELWAQKICEKAFIPPKTGY